ncbi:protein of unknown function [Burkholderia multivorans]
MKGMGENRWPVARRVATGREAGVQQDRLPKEPDSFPFGPMMRAWPAPNGGVHAGSNPVYTKTLKENDSVSL